MATATPSLIALLDVPSRAALDVEALSGATREYWRDASSKKAASIRGAIDKLPFEAME